MLQHSIKICLRLINILQTFPFKQKFRGTYISWKASLKGFLWFIFTDHQVEYIVSLSYCFYSRIKILHSVSLQRNPQILRPSTISAYTVLQACTFPKAIKVNCSSTADLIVGRTNSESICSTNSSKKLTKTI